MNNTCNDELSADLKKLGVTNLRPQQEAPLRAILASEDVIVIMPTGGGKSLLFQMPAILDHGQRLTLVISPLRALQTDQVGALRSKGVCAAVLNSDLSTTEHHTVLQDAVEHSGLLYLTPEQLQNAAVAEALRQTNVARVAVDEAHILPQVKDDFRKAYGEIGTFIETLPKRPQILALTATATPNDVRRIRKSLGMSENTKVFRSPMRRDNLRLSIKSIQADKTNTIRFQAVECALSQWNRKGSVIIFCPTVKMVKRLHKWLKARDYPVGKYHGKMKQTKRKQAQASFMSGETPVMVATNAFGLGIDKSNVRMVIHAGLPLSMDGYVQEIGRAGRDRKKARCVLIYTKSDFERNKRIISQSGGKKAVRRKLKRLYALQKLIDSDDCLWREIERYFGEKKQKRCKNCCNCAKKRK